VPELRSVNFIAAQGTTPEQPGQWQYMELVEGAAALPARVKVLWGGVPLEQVTPAVAAAAIGAA
jgi:hypothetical protein